jgi:predicted nucleotidyltransferase
MTQAVRANYGGLENEEMALNLLVSRLVDALDPEMIWLFGSRARRDNRNDSDFDLLVVAKQNGSFGSDDYDLVHSAISDLWIGADVIPCDLDVFKVSLDLKTSFVRRIVDEGRIVYGHAGHSFKTDFSERGIY